MADVVAARLRELVHGDALPAPLRAELEAATKPKLDGASTADPAGLAARMRVSHVLLARIADWARVAPRNAPVAHEQLSLVALVNGSCVYVPRPPAYVRPKELDASLDAIREKRDREEYARLVSGDRHSRTPASGAPALSGAEERRAWREARAQTSATTNIIITTLTVGVAAWWAGGNADPIRVRLGCGAALTRRKQRWYSRSLSWSASPSMCSMRATFA